MEGKIVAKKVISNEKIEIKIYNLYLFQKASYLKNISLQGKVLN